MANTRKKSGESEDKTPASDNTPPAQEDITPPIDSTFDFDFDALRTDRNDNLLSLVQQPTTFVGMNVPKDQSIRIHPEWSWQGVIIEASSEERRSFGSQGSWTERYIVAAELLHDPLIRSCAEKFVRNRMINPVIARNGDIYLWHTAVPLDGQRRRYHDAVDEIVERGRKEWGMISWDRASNCYTWTPSEGIRREPEWPHDVKSIDQLLGIAYKERLVKEMSHPLILRLRGIE